MIGSSRTKLREGTLGHQGDIKSSLTGRDGVCILTRFNGEVCLRVVVELSLAIQKASEPRYLRRKVHDDDLHPDVESQS